jgi:putative glycosyltransferase (TIGR04372 family)
MVIVFLSIASTLIFASFRLWNKLKIKKNIKFGEAYTQPKFGRERLWNISSSTTFNKNSQIPNTKDTLGKLKFEIKLQDHSEKKCQNLLRQMGIAENDWFVCLHVREGGFWRDESINVERNASIKNYIEAIKAIIKKGGFVVRMGDSTMTKLPKMAGCIDYPFTKYKSDEMDLYLLKSCALYIGMQSGIYDVAVLFSRPIILTNMVSWLFPFPPKKGDLGILKHVYDRKRNKEISIKERLSCNWELSGHSVDGNKYTLIENSPEDILELVEEYFRDCKKINYTDLQIKFHTQRVKKGIEIIEEEKSLDVTEKYRLFSSLHCEEGALGASFLIKYY